MTVDFQQVRTQVKQLGESAAQNARERARLRQQAFSLLEQYGADAGFLLERVERIARLHDPNLRCALPALGLKTPPEALNFRGALPSSLPHATLLAADGSQINPDRHAQVDYSLVNVGAIQVRLELPDAPQITVTTRLLYDEELYTPEGVLSETQVALMRDLHERSRLAELAKEALPPVITFTDGPLELWGARDGQESQAFERSLEEYQQALGALQQLEATTAGYVDKPSANLVVRLLEIAALEEAELKDAKKKRPLGRVSDRSLFQELLAPGERSAVFAMQSRSAQRYRDELRLHFFYLNVGRPGKPWLSRVEIPLWVADNRESLDSLHAVLYQQCRIMGSRPYPYLIHRAHEAAVVSLEEKDQITQMIVSELIRRGVEVGEVSQKQSTKDLARRTRL
jgi:hypothetical protein